MTTLANFQDDTDSTGKTFPLHPEGSHIVRLADIFVLPTIPPRKADAKPYTPLQTILISRKTDNDGRPIWLWYQLGSGIYVSKQGKSKAFLLYEALLGQTLGKQEALSVDLESLVGRYARAAVSHVPNAETGKITARVVNVSALSEDDPIPDISLKGYERPVGKKINYRDCVPKWNGEAQS